MTEPLVALVEDAAGDTDPLWLAVRLRAAADKVGANVSASSRAVADASTADDGQAYLDLVTQALTAGSSHNADNPTWCSALRQAGRLVPLQISATSLTRPNYTRRIWNEQAAQ